VAAETPQTRFGELARMLLGPSGVAINGAQNK
jgi:hypothetical protein